MSEQIKSEITSKVMSHIELSETKYDKDLFDENQSYEIKKEKLTKFKDRGDMELKSSKEAFVVIYRTLKTNEEEQICKQIVGDVFGKTETEVLFVDGSASFKDEGVFGVKPA